MSKHSIHKILILLVFIIKPIYASWHDRKSEGWAWYEKKAFEPEPTPLESTETPSEILSKAKKDLDEKLAIALLNPTLENVESYMKLQQKWVEQSAQFATAWNRALLHYPDLDQTVVSRPVSQYGLQLHKAEQQKKKEKFIFHLASDQGLMFFYEGRSPTSVAFAQVVKEFSQKYGWETLAISVDGEIIVDFPNSKIDNGISQTMGINVFPSLVVINPRKNSVTPIAYGLVSMDKIEENIEVQYQDL